MTTIYVQTRGWMNWKGGWNYPTTTALQILSSEYEITRPTFDYFEHNGHSAWHPTETPPFRESGASPLKSTRTVTTAEYIPDERC
ncbi:hypothetical protein K440DRAFT_631526 [Wilcoxina mikolae CBS 423.85]|nr:hypothetical protein K440DRAFT_631526 [Wilcoxina mikolae CBS 423.85]